MDIKNFSFFQMIAANRKIFVLIVIVYLVFSCSDKTKQISYKPIFTSFEISLHPGMGKHFSLLVDSNKIYFSPQLYDTCFYGVLPDTVLKSIDSFCLNLQKSIYKTIENPYYDCSMVAVKAIIGKDTFQIHQFGNVEQPIFTFIDFLEKSIKQSKHKVLNAWLFLETQRIVLPPPPAILSFKKKKFKFKSSK